MQKMAFISLITLVGFVIPGHALIITKKNMELRPVASLDVRKNIFWLEIMYPKVRSSFAIKNGHNFSDKLQAAISGNPYQSYFDRNPSAQTELKIDLESFNVEYVLKVQ